MWDLLQCDPGWGGVKQYCLWINNGWRWKTGTWELIIFFYFSTCLKFSVIKIPHLIFLALSTEKITILYLRLTWPVWFMFVSSNSFDPYNTPVGQLEHFTDEVTEKAKGPQRLWLGERIFPSLMNLGTEVKPPYCGLQTLVPVWMLSKYF